MSHKIKDKNTRVHPYRERPAELSDSTEPETMATGGRPTQPQHGATTTSSTQRHRAHRLQRLPATTSHQSGLTRCRPRLTTETTPPPPSHISTDRRREISRQARSLALFRWFENNNLKFILPENVEVPSEKELIKRQAGETYLKGMNWSFWIQYYRAWSVFQESLPAELNTQHICTTVMITQQEGEALNSKIAEYYSQLEDIPFSLDTHTQHVRKLEQDLRIQIQETEKRALELKLLDQRTNYGRAVSQVSEMLEKTTLSATQEK